jgi:hypothetical protein
LQMPATKTAARNEGGLPLLTPHLIILNGM